MKRKILFAIPSLKLGGAERVVTQLVQHLPRDRFAIHLALVEKTGPYTEQIPSDVCVHDLGARRVRYGIFALWRLVWRLRPDVLFPHLSYLSLAVMMMRPFLPAGTRVLLQETTTLSAQLKEGSWQRVRRAAYRALYPRADAIVCCSRAMLEDLVQELGVSRARLRHVPNPIDLDDIESRLRGRPSPYSGAGPHLLGVGRLAHEKGYDRLIGAFALLAERRQDVQLWLLGEGPERGALERKVDERGLRGRVHFVGFESNPYPWMQHADVFVQSSRREGLPVAVLEALACRVPVVGFDCPGGTRELLEGIEGTVLVPDGNLAALASAIERMLEPNARARPVLPPQYRLEEVLRAYAEVLAEGGNSAADAAIG